MISEKQKQIIFNTNCLYQLVGQVNRIENKQDIEMLPEISMYAIFQNVENPIDWNNEMISLYNKSISLGLSKEWTTQLGNNVLKYTKEFGDLNEFRNSFMTSIDLLLQMINSIALSASHVPKEHLAQTVIGDIFDKDYWEGETVNHVKIVRKLNTELKFSKEWVIEFSTILLISLE